MTHLVRTTVQDHRFWKDLGLSSMTTTTLEGGTYRLIREHGKGGERH